MLRENRCSIAGDYNPQWQHRTSVLVVLLLLVGIAAGSIGAKFLSADQNPSSASFEISMNRVMEMKSRADADSASMTAHHLNIFGKVMGGIDELKDAASMPGPAGDGAKRALEHLRMRIENAVAENR